MLIGSAEVLQRIDMRAAIAAVEATVLAFSAGRVGTPVAAGVRVPAGTFHVKACAAAAGEGGLFIAKINSNFPANRARAGLPTIQGVIAVFDASNGKLRALVDSASITSLRTAATTAVAVEHLAREGAAVATVVGCGVLGRRHVEALAACGFTTMRLFDQDAALAREMAAWASATLRVECVAADDLRQATLASDVIVTCTSSPTAFLGPDDVRPGTFIAAVGADNEQKSEIQPALLARARIVADLTEQCMKIGDLRNAPGGQSSVCGELADVVAGRVARTSSSEIVMFDSTGLALEDLALCELICGGATLAAGSAEE